MPFMAMSSHDRFLIETPLRPGNAKPARNTTFFFSGGICGSGRYNVLPPNCTYYKQQRYSGGVRQAVSCALRLSWWGGRARASVAGAQLTSLTTSTPPHTPWCTQVYEHFHARAGWRVVPKTDDYARDYSSSRFCLAAPGGGWGKRGIVSAMYGCIPVAATDFLYEVRVGVGVRTTTLHGSPLPGRNPPASEGCT